MKHPLCLLTLLAVLLFRAAPALAAPNGKDGKDGKDGKGGDGKTFTYSNPVQFLGTGPGSDLRDPAITRVGDTYYLVFTMWPFRNYTDRDPKLPDWGSSRESGCIRRTT